MTPTEQDNELRSILLGYRAELSQGLNELATGKSAEEFYGEKLEQLLASHLQALITSDRKRVELEARIYELELAKISPKFKIEERIAGLKAQLEKL